MPQSLYDLEGEHLLSGVEVLSSEGYGYGVVFTLDGYPMRFWRIPTTAIVAIVVNLRWRNSLRSFPSLRSPSSVLCAPMIRWLSSMMIFWIFTIQKRTSGFSPSEPQIMMTGTPTLIWSITLSIFPATNAKRFPRPSSVPFYRRRVSYVEVLMGARRAP